MSENGDDRAWYALRTRSRHEKLVARQLATRGVEAFLPIVVRRQRWADRWKPVSFPLFPGYCFGRFRHGRLEERRAVVTTVGVVQILGMHGEVTPIPDAEIGTIRQVLDSGLAVDPHPYLKEGMSVEIVRGPLQGVRAVLIRKDRHARVVVSVHLIRQSASVELDAADVAPLA